MSFIIDGHRIKEYKNPNIPRNRKLKCYARENRKKMNLAEVVFWLQVHKNKFYGIDFTRQSVIGNYIADFYVRKLCLVVEIDGGYHNDRQEYDRKRDCFMRSLGLKVYRVSDYDVLHNLRWVMADLKRFILENYEHE